MLTPILSEDCQSLARELAPLMQPLAGSTVLVTGAAGFIGSVFVDLLAAWNRTAPQPCRILAMDNLMVGLPARIAHWAEDPAITWMRHALPEPLPALPQPDYIIHAAGIGSPMIYRGHPLETIAVNVDGTRQMLDLARKGAKGMLYFSSSEIYGDPALVPTPEDYRGHVSCTGPRACYDESKRLAETLCVSYHRVFGTDVRIIRPFNVYGPGQRVDDGRIIPDLMKTALAGGPLVLFSDGRATRSFCYVTDYLKGCLMVLFKGRPGEAYNVGNDQEVSILDAARTMAQVAGGLVVEHAQSRDPDFLVDNPQRRCPDLAKLRALGYRPTVMLAEGLDRTFRSYRQERDARAAAE